jgi:hypothetical protein
MSRWFEESIDVRDSNRYERVREGTGKGGCGEVGTIWTGVGFRIIEIVSKDGYWIYWTGYNGGLFQSRRAATDSAIRELERCRHVKEVVIT